MHYIARKGFLIVDSHARSLTRMVWFGLFEMPPKTIT
jgi:hypothetical protein